MSFHDDIPLNGCISLGDRPTEPEPEHHQMLDQFWDWVDQRTPPQSSRRHDGWSKQFSDCRALESFWRKLSEETLRTLEFDGGLQSVDALGHSEPELLQHSRSPDLKHHESQLCAQSKSWAAGLYPSQGFIFPPSDEAYRCATVTWDNLQHLERAPLREQCQGSRTPGMFQDGGQRPWSRWASVARGVMYGICIGCSIILPLGIPRYETDAEGAVGRVAVGKLPGVLPQIAIPVPLVVSAIFTVAMSAAMYLQRNNPAMPGSMLAGVGSLIAVLVYAGVDRMLRVLPLVLTWALLTSILLRLLVRSLTPYFDISDAPVRDGLPGRRFGGSYLARSNHVQTEKTWADDAGM